MADVYSYGPCDIAEALERFGKRCREYDAVICSTDIMGVLLLNRLKEVGVKLPEEIAVTGFDNLILSRLTHPYLTTARIDFTEIGRLSFFAIELIKKQRLPAGLKLLEDCRILRRGSAPLNWDRPPLSGGTGQ